MYIKREALHNKEIRLFGIALKKCQEDMLKQKLRIKLDKAHSRIEELELV